MLFDKLLASLHCKHGDDTTLLYFVQQTVFYFNKYNILTIK